jgi:hypothetical protein
MVPQPPPQAWQRACLDLAARISTWRKPDRDCRDLLVEVTPKGALVTITTHDGRQAKRSVVTPDHLTSVASALTIGLHEPPPGEAVDPSPANRDVRVADDTREPRLVGPPVGHEAVVVAAAGARMGSPGGFVSPLLRAMAGLDAGRLELGFWADFAPQHWLAAAEAPPNFKMWSMAVGVTAGVRQPVGGGVDLIGGLVFGPTFVSEKSTEEKLKDDGSIEQKEHAAAGVDPNLGAYIGFVVPRRLGIRLRSLIELDLPISHPFQGRELDSDLPPLAGWNMSAIVGAEIGVP